jgi:predicted ferric reductase
VDRKPTTAEIVLMASGAVALIFSFFDFYSSDLPGVAGVSAWSSGLFPIATYIPILGAIVAVQVALKVFAGIQMSPRVLGFTWQQIHLILGVFVLLIAVGYLLVDRSGLASLAVGFWFMLLASIGLLVGAILETNEATSPR